MEKIRVLIAKPGLDGHDRGAKLVARACKEAGMEVIYTGLHQSADMIVSAAMQEDVHVIGLSILSGAHNELVPTISQGLKKVGLKNCLILVGGVIPEQDVDFLKKSGASMVFTPGTSLENITSYIQKNVKSKLN